MTSINPKVMRWLLDRPSTSFTQYVRRSRTVR